MQVLAHARRILLSTICLYHHHLIPLRVLVCFVLCFFFLLLRPRASALTTTSLLEVVLSVNGWSRARRAVSPIFNRDSPLHLILRLLSFLISAFSREPGNGNLLFILRFCNYQLPSYTSIRRRLSLSLSHLSVSFSFIFLYSSIIRLGHCLIIVYSSLNGMSYGIFVASVLIALVLRDSSYIFSTLSYTSRPAMERTEHGVRLLGFYLHLLFG